ncbi:MAG: glycosyltransferase family 2 protein, partial [Acidimicrobiales bacterium]
MPEELAPSVVAVIVTSDPEEGFEDCLESLGAQDYPNLAVLVVDDASAVDVTSRVAAILPAAIVRRRSERGGFAAAANEALSGISGATFFLICHDDVELDLSATRVLVEESFRSNAAVVGPKFVSAENPDRLLQVGLGMHRLGTPAPRVEPGELDQSQHDEARDVFVAPGGCTLIRADLLEALGGFDPSMTLFGEDIDLCWRAQIAGARVAVAPGARVRHRQLATSGSRGLGDQALLRRRHELRAALKNYGAWLRWQVVVELLILGLAEMVVGVITGERERARRVVRAWRWNFAERRSLRAARAHLRLVRQVSDRKLLKRMQGRGRVRRFFRPELPVLSVRHREPTGAEAQVSSWWTRLQRGEVPAAQLTLASVLLLVGLLGLRGLIFGRLPLVGQLIKMPTGWSMLGRFFSGVPVGNHLGPAPTAYGIVGLIGLVLGDSSSMAWKLVMIGALVVGALGVSRLCRPFLSSRARLVASAVFVALPLAWNSLATGNVQAAVALGALPYVSIRVARATALEPFGSRFAGPSKSWTTSSVRAALGEIVPLGILLAVFGALAPAGLLGAGAVLCAVVAMCLLNGRVRSALRAVTISAGAVVVAAACCLPWSLTWFESGARWSAFAGAVPGAAMTPASLLRGH